MNTTVLNFMRLNVARLNFIRLNASGAARGKGVTADTTADLLTEQGGFFRLEDGGKTLLETKEGKRGNVLM